jgi:hypothetical protein
MSREDLPHIQFYIGDWRKDVGVQSLSYHYRGIWLELLMLMHCSEQRGRLVLNAKPMSDPSISRLLGLTQQEGANAIQVLLESAVASRDSEGALICRRMVKEEEIKAVRRKAGSKGLAKRWQNPDTDIGNENGLELGSQEARKDRAGSLAEVIEFCRSIGLPKSDAEWFWHKCEANGWTNSGKRILDWKSVLRSWKAGGYVPSVKNPAAPGAKERTRPLCSEPKASAGDTRSDEQMERDRQAVARGKAELKEKIGR